MTYRLKQCLISQFETAWMLASYHLDGLTTEECLWRPARRGLHVAESSDGRWLADWPESEGYDIGPPSIGWLTWHMGFWWSMALDHSFGTATLTREDVAWPGSAEAAVVWIRDLADQWRNAIGELPNEEWQSSERTRWPMQDKPFSDVVAWASVELTKNASEIGYARFLHAVA